MSMHNSRTETTLRTVEDDTRMTEAFKLWALRWEPTQDEMGLLAGWAERQRRLWAERLGKAG